MSLLKLHSKGVRCCQRPALHSTMSLLKPSVSYDEHTHGNIFTFHYVSIKTSVSYDEHTHGNIFTFHYVSIKTQIMQARWAIRATLHSTMSLLKRWVKMIGDWFLLYFTFHYVSIKTVCRIWFKLSMFSFTFHYVSIKTKTQITTDIRSLLTLHSTMSLLKLPSI